MKYRCCGSWKEISNLLARQWSKLKSMPRCINCANKKLHLSLLHSEAAELGRFSAPQPSFDNKSGTLDMKLAQKPQNVSCLKIFIFIFLTFNVWRIPPRDKTLQKGFLTKHLKLLISEKEVPLQTSWLNLAPWVIWVSHFLGNLTQCCGYINVFSSVWMIWFFSFLWRNLNKPQVGCWLYLSQSRPFLVTNLNPETEWQKKQMTVKKKITSKKKIG